MDYEDDQIKPGKDFFIKLAFIPFGVVVIFFIIFGFLLGFSEVLKNALGLFLIGFLFLEALVMFTALVVSRRFIDFFKDAGKKSFFITIGLLFNLGIIIYDKPKFLFDFHPFQEDLPIVLTAIIAWIIYPLLISKEIKNQIIESARVVLATLSLLTVIMSIVFFAIIDILILFFSFFPLI